MNMSAPRTDSEKRQYVVPSANVETSRWPRSTPSWSAMRAASAGCEVPATTISRLRGAGSRQFARFTAVSGSTSFTSRPGSRVSSVVALSICMSFLVDLTGTCDRECAGRDIVRDDRARRNPSIVSNLDRSNECILYAGPDVAPDRRPALGFSGLVREVDRDVPGRHVGVLTDIRIAEIGEVRHLRPGADPSLLQLHERPHLRIFGKDRSRPEVRERADHDARADLGVDGNDVWADLGTGADVRLAAQHHERVDRRVGLELDGRIDPGRRGIDDR